MARQFKLALVGLLALLSVCAWQPRSVHAQTTVNGFEVRAVLPSDNRSGSNFFDLNLHPGTERRLPVKITNNSAKTQHFYVQPNNATTNSNGIIDYSNGTRKDVSASTSLTDMLSDKTGLPVVIKGHRSSVVTFRLKAPGAILCGDCSRWLCS